MRKTKFRNKRKRNFIFIFLSVLMLAIALTFGYIAMHNTNSNQDKNSDITATAQSDTTPTVESDITDQTGQSTQSEPSEVSPSTATNIDNVDPIKAQIEKMSLEEKVGQLVIVGVDGYKNDDHSAQMIKKHHVGGFILFKNNIQDTKQMLALLNSLKETNLDNKVPLFLSVDEEGGRVSRLPAEFLKFPTNKKIGELNDSYLSYQIGSIIGEELKSVGFNMDFAPVLDINSNPKNTVIGDRSFGSKVDLVSELGIQTMKGLQSKSIISVVKHFPGHGDTSVDSHIGLPTVNYDMDRLKSFELMPFAAAIENKVDAVMVAHILLPKIDPNNPASFSKTIISDILRADMGFDGVVLTDDFTMGAIIKNYDIGEAAVKSIQAGSDIVLVCHEFDKQEAVINALKNAAATGKISRDRLDQSVYRILKLKEKYSFSSETVKSVDPQSINNKIKKLFK
ncbi:MAG TPA: beta-N-acetylhexosaminidase [Ruminiclostridium sp.]